MSNDTNLIPKWQRRVEGEYNELLKRMSKLMKFIKGGPDVPQIDMELLNMQYDAMAEYAFVLEQRLKRFEAGGPDDA